MHQLDLLLFPNITCKEHKKPADVDNKATALHSNMCILTTCKFSIFCLISLGFSSLKGLSLICQSKLFSQLSPPFTSNICSRLHNCCLTLMIFTITQGHNTATAISKDQKIKSVIKMGVNSARILNQLRQTNEKVVYSESFCTVNSLPRSLKISSS